MNFDRIHMIVLDSVGIGEAPDADKFGDIGSHTLGHIAEARGLDIPNLEQLGLGNIEEIAGVAHNPDNAGYYGKLEEVSVGKDTMTGHWELMGLEIDTPFRVFPEGFPDELIQKIEEYSGRKVIGNKPASGTAIIEELGPEQMETGALIVYTSADPVLQLAAHEEVIPLEELYDICEYIREITRDEPYMLGRVIARPYIGEPGSFERMNEHRHDYALDPFGETVLDKLKAEGKDVVAVGKINDIFNGQGITKAIHTDNNMDGVDKLLAVIESDFDGFSFTNLVDFDSKYGHRRDPEGYGQAIEDFDARITEIMRALPSNDLLIITADHGNDPTFTGTDHTREYVPVLAYAHSLRESGELSDGHFFDISATIAENFGVEGTGNGKSFLGKLI